MKWREGCLASKGKEGNLRKGCQHSGAHSAPEGVRLIGKVQLSVVFSGSGELSLDGEAAGEANGMK